MGKWEEKVDKVYTEEERAERERWALEYYNRVFEILEPEGLINSDEWYVIDYALNKFRIDLEFSDFLLRKDLI